MTAVTALRQSAPPTHPIKKSDPTTEAAIRILIWIYFLLLVTEGIFRKWLLPQLSNELLFARDPILLMIYALAAVRGEIFASPYAAAVFGIGACSIFTGLTLGTGNFLVTLYGFDANFFHLPLIFVAATVLKREDVVKIGRWILLLSIPMAFLMVAQFRSSPFAWINCGAGGGLGAQMDAGMGKIRPPGYFTFITGAAEFYALVAAFLIYGLITRKVYKPVLLYSAGVAMVIGTGVSTSRLTLGGIAVVFLMTLVISIFDRRVLAGAGRLIIAVSVVFLVVSNLDVFHEGTAVFEARLVDTGDAGSGAMGTASNWTHRTFGDLFDGIEATKMSPVFGMGLGMGTNVGAQLLTGAVGFLVAEGEWARIILEIGPILGWLYLAVRLAILVKLGREAVKSVRAGNYLPIYLFGACALLVLSGQFRQATTLGFAALGAGLCLSANNVIEVAPDNPDLAPDIEPAAPVRRPGRSRIAAALHGDTPIEVRRS